MDPLLACIVQLASRFGYAPNPGQFELIARDDRGRVPFHQATDALDVAGLNFDVHSGRRLPLGDDNYPALVRLADDGPIAVHEISGAQALVWRPDRGGEPVWEDLQPLKAGFSGEFITVLGDPDALRGEDAPMAHKARHHWFWSELRKERKALRPVLVASLLINLLALSLPLFTMNVYDRVIPNKATASLWVLASGVALAFLMEFMLRRARTDLLDQTGRRLDLKLSQKIFRRLLAAPMGARRSSTGAMVARVSEYALVRDFFASTTVVLLVDLAFLVLFLVVIVYIAGWLAVVPAAAMIAMLVAGFYLQRKVADAARDVQADHGLQQTLLTETVAGTETLKSVGGEGNMIGRWYALAEMGGRSTQRMRRINATAVGLASSFQQFSSVALVVGGYYLFSAGQITMGAIIAIVMLSSRSLAPAAQFAFLLTRGRQAKQALESVDSLFAAGDERRHTGSIVPAISSQARIQLDNVSFTYGENMPPALEGVSLTIEPGERIALIGRVAAGKSTLGRVMCGLYPPSEGQMLIDGIDSRQFRPHDIRGAFRFVGQDAALFTGSLKDNLQLADRAAGEEALREALRKSGADEFLARDAGGFDRAMGDKGSALSGGQRSFVALSRAFVTPFQMLFLDEPTGAMDSRTERLFVERLQTALSESQTLVVSTHRPALFSLCDRIIVMDGGRIVADGPKAQILAQAETRAGMVQ